MYLRIPSKIDVENQVKRICFKDLIMNFHYHDGIKTDILPHYGCGIFNETHWLQYSQNVWQSWVID